MKLSPLQRQAKELMNEACAALAGTRGLPRKRVGSTRYMHLVSCGEKKIAARVAALLSKHDLIECAADDLLIKQCYEDRVSILIYPDFLKTAHPTLAISLDVPLGDSDEHWRVRRYRNNRPVLHRKELLLPPDAPEHAAAADLTRQEESAGLLDKPFSFGFERQWEQRLADAGYELTGHILSPKKATQ